MIKQYVEISLPDISQSLINELCLKCLLVDISKDCHPKLFFNIHIPISYK